MCQGDNVTVLYPESLDGHNEDLSILLIAFILRNKRSRDNDFQSTSYNVCLEKTQRHF
jgi:hypothetical protein